LHFELECGDSYGTNKLVCDGVVLDSYIRIGAACLDDCDRVHCVRVRDDTLKYVLLHEPTLIIGNGDGIVWCDITTDGLAEPVITFCRNEGSVWVVHGVGIVGLSDGHGGPVVRSLPRAASIVSAVLMLGAVGSRQDTGYRAELLDISGRKAMGLRPGDNDVSSIAPGVYFVTTSGGERNTRADRVVMVR
jgi:hypothetical protein